jgi:hypothetical protein
MVGTAAATASILLVLMVAVSRTVLFLQLTARRLLITAVVDVDCITTGIAVTSFGITCLLIEFGGIAFVKEAPVLAIVYP